MARNEHRAIPYRPPREEIGQRGSWLLILKFARHYVKPHIWSVLACIVLVSLNACSVYLQSYYGRVVVDEILVIGSRSTSKGMSQPSAQLDRVIETNPRPAEHGLSERTRLTSENRPPWASRRLFRIFIIYLLTILALNMADRATQRIRSRVAASITRRLRDDIHNKIIGLSTSFHQTHAPGRLMSRILSDVDVVQKNLMDLIINATSQVIMFIAGVVILLVLDWRMAVIVVLAMIPYVMFAGRVRVKLRRINREIRHSNSCLWGLVTQKLETMRAIVAYGRERAELLNFHRLSSCFLRDTLYQQRLGAGMNRTADMISAITVRGIFLACAIKVLAGNMSLGQMMYIHGASANLFMPVIQLTLIILHMTHLLVILQRLAHTLETREEVVEDPHAVPFPVPVRYGINFKEVCFSWSSRQDPVLDDISLDIPAGKWVCIMGPSGSGKTTLLQLIARLFDPQEGEINVDGFSLERIGFDSLRRNMAFVPQEAQILSGTVRDNIMYGRADASPNEIMAAAQAAECHDFIMRLPVKYETLVGERGATLSGGQRQRISIARALLTQPEVLLLDDCTSALDADTERRLQETLTRLMVGKTAVIVSQRISMAMRCHRVIVLRNGRIIENGRPDDLRKQGGYYAQLYDQQMQ